MWRAALAFAVILVGVATGVGCGNRDQGPAVLPKKFPGAMAPAAGASKAAVPAPPAGKKT